MTRANVTTPEIAKCLEILKAASTPLVAARLAAMLHLSGSRETRRRHVRAIIKQLRDNGSMIVANLQGGYWLTDDEQLYKDYLEGRQIDAKKVLGQTHRQKRELLQDRSGQELLFDFRIQCGCATIGI